MRLHTLPLAPAFFGLRRRGVLRGQCAAVDQQTRWSAGSVGDPQIGDALVVGLGAQERHRRPIRRQLDHPRLWPGKVGIGIHAFGGKLVCVRRSAGQHNGRR